MSSLLSIFGICLHSRLSFPQTQKESGECSVVCLDCTARFAYDAKTWKRGVKR